ncbi:hypothetical protein [Desulfovibrio sp.]|uniref:hypothetical protein n=1 Tax=Desulfovibrio sp. TaxID=885 RepID=UPI0025BA654D|nr:hypothetical protein [Desulfovibrio sp.]
MKGLAELVVSLCDLCEAEGRLLEAGILRTVRRAGLLSLGLLFGAAALALLLGALYTLLTSLLPTPAALGLLGGASALIAALLLWGARGGAAQDAGEPKPAEASSKPGAVQAAASPKPAAVQPTAGAHDPWAEVAPYGHGAAPAAPAQAGKGASPAGNAGMQEKR